MFADRENLRAALRWSVEQQRSEPGLRIVGALWFWYFLSFREGQAWAEALLRLPEAATLTFPRAKALFTASATAWAAGDGPAVARHGTEGVALAKALHSPERLAYALSVIASNMPDAQRNLHAHYAECLLAAEDVGDAWLVAFARLCYAVAAAQVGDLQTASEQGRRAVGEARAVADDWLVALAGGPLGLALVFLGQVDEAERYLEEALGTFRQLGDRKWVVNSLLGLGMVARQRGEVDAMARSYVESLILSRDAGDTGNLPLTLEGVAATAIAWGEARTAARLLGAAESANALGGQPILPVFDQLCSATKASARQPLGEAAFSVAWQEGQRLTVDEAVAVGQELLAVRPEPR